MSTSDRPVVLVTRGSPLALAQTRQVLAACQAACPEFTFELRVIKTTGDKLQKASMAQESKTLPKGLFTKELEVALLRGEGDLAVHSLKDLPTDLPPGLKLGAVPERVDVRDVLIYRSEQGAAWRPPEEETAPAPDTPAPRPFPAGISFDQLPSGATVATSSTRRREQLLARRPDLRVVEIRGNVGTRLQKLLRQPGLDAMILAAAGLERLGYAVREDGTLMSRPEGAGDDLREWREEAEFRATFLSVEDMLPCVGQAALGIEVRADDPRMAILCDRLDDPDSHRCVAAERAFLHAMGGGCQSPVAALAEIAGETLRLRAVSFRAGPRRAAELAGPLDRPEALGRAMAEALR